MAATDANTPAPTAAEVGMMFVHEYYTLLHKDPARLHCFYDKTSTVSHATEGAEPTEIQSHITNLDYDDCRVLVRTVESQASLNGGIMVQVLGEMSNKGSPSQRFVQTFFLAEQHQGYYVLNDIFRYIKDINDEVEAELEHDTTDEVEILAVVGAPEPAVTAAVTAGVVVVEEAEAHVVAVQAEEAIIVAQVEVTEPAQPVEAAPAPEEEKVVESKEVVEEKKTPVEEKRPAERKKHDKKRDSKKDDKREKKEDKESKKEEAKEAKKEEAKEAKKEDAKETEPTEKPKAPESSQNQNTANESASAAAAAAPTPAAAAAPAEPSKPKSWADLAAVNSAQWGAHVAPTKGSSINVSQPTPTSKPQATQSNAPLGRNRPQGQRPNGREDFHGIYVKNITDKMTLDQLRETFSKFGPVKNLELTKTKTCAYVDFETAEAVQAALKQKTVNVGSEVVLAEERHRNGVQNGGGRSFHYQNGGGSSNHQGSHGGHRNNRSPRGGIQDRNKPIQKPEKASPTVAVN
ncbi:hypothetical protein B0O80DRAFT_500654 [Mortierella sp. GBAus27b]|nr:hypothetical protein BGX31_007980 [Mortierella sp. GBA43]KAI8350440.1 hypothetical protein B0O80DRAFT_500654 [Mortierella sp. GBAus27b]